jgi:hypothetical protein
MAAVAISSYSKIVGTVHLVVLTFLLKNISAENHDNANTHKCVTKVYTVCSTSCIAGLRRQCYYVVYEPSSPINLQ